MQRIVTAPRVNWQAEVQKLGYDFHDPAGIPHWNESAYYVLDQTDVERLTQAARELHGLYVETVQHVIDNRLFPLTGITDDVADKITECWNLDVPTILGRFDFLYDGVDDPKLLEYNADTPGNLFETAIVQKNWREQRFPGSDQCNLLNDAITNRWRELRVGNDNNRLHLVADRAIPEDVENAQYVGACAAAAGYSVKYLSTTDVGTADGNFYDLEDQVMTQVFKQYGWDFFVKDSFFQFVDYSRCWWLEPIWKMAFQCKGLLPMLWDLFPEHPNLLPAFSMSGMIDGDFVKKPLWGRQGANIEVVVNGKILAHTGGRYTNDGYIYQAYREAPVIDGQRPVFGVWIVCDQPCAIGIREDTGLITTPTSRFVPHIIA